MAIQAYSDIVIVDITDGKQAKIYLTSNQPSVVVYDPNNTASPYTPDWSTNNLVLTPTLFVDNTQKALTDTGVAITWTRQAGSGAVTDLVTGESVKDGILTVSNNVLSTVSAGILTYICQVVYTDPDTGIEASDMISMSFSLVKNATELKDCTLSGEQVFTYNGEGTLTSASSIVITANLTNTSISQWQYKTADGSFAKYPNSDTKTTLTVNATDTVFVNNVAIIKCLTTDNIYDLHQIIKVKDGAAGADTYSCILSNDSQSVPCASDGSLYESSLNGCTSTITVYHGGEDDTENWTITATPSAGVTGTYNSSNYTYTVTGLTVDAGYVEFVAAKAGNASITKRFSIIKERSGADGDDAVFHNIVLSTPVLKLTETGVFTPTTVTFSAQKIVGDGSPTTYTGRFKISESTNGSKYTLKYTSSSDEASKTYTPSSTAIVLIKCELFASGGTTTIYDIQTCSIVKDGVKGDDGDNGIDAINVVLGNSSEVIPCTVSGTAVSAKDITIPFSCYQGTKRVAGTATVGTLPSGVTVKSNTAATASADGSIVLTVAKGATLSSTATSGDITITFTVSGLTSTHKFTWTKNIQAESAVLLQVYAPQGDVIVNKENNVTLNTTLTYGTNAVTSGVTYQWAKYEGTSYTNITTGGTSSSLTVTPDMVDGVASFRCTATYGGKPYIAYWCVTDKSDPVQLYLHSTIGDKIVNGQGVGAIYALAFRNGDEIDPIKSTVFSTNAPSNPSDGDYYYKLDKSAKTVTLMKYDGSAWDTASADDAPKGTYSWYRRSADGVIIDTSTAWKTGKAIYIDADIIDGKIILSCKFEM